MTFQDLYVSQSLVWLFISPVKRAAFREIPGFAQECRKSMHRSYGSQGKSLVLGRDPCSLLVTFWLLPCSSTSSTTAPLICPCLDPVATKSPTACPQVCLVGHPCWPQLFHSQGPQSTPYIPPPEHMATFWTLSKERQGRLFAT